MEASTRIEQGPYDTSCWNELETMPSVFTTFAEVSESLLYHSVLLMTQDITIQDVAELLM